MKSLEDERHFFYLNISRQLELLITDKGIVLQIRRERAGTLGIMFMQTHVLPPRRREVGEVGERDTEAHLPLPPSPRGRRLTEGGAWGGRLWGGVPTPAVQQPARYRI